MVKIALVGFGKMGQTIKRLADAKKDRFEIVSIIDPMLREKTIDGVPVNTVLTKVNLNNADVCIDYTHPSVIMKNIKIYSDMGVNVVVGTTGWYDKKEEVTQMVENSEIGLIWSGNFSIGVNAFFKIIENAAKVMNKLDDYDVMALEYHHNQKADSPSGTAEMIGKILIDKLDRKDKLYYDKLDRKIEPNELHLASVRGGNIPGIHEVTFDSPQDTITLKHSARNREGFASGSLLAAEFIKDKTGIFNIDDLMLDIIN
jgi:4-hydroxy-tetrahydrodipicolinate reductase